MKKFSWLAVLLLCLAYLPLSAQGPSTYRILSRERESLQCRLDLIRQARHEILLSTYTIKQDYIGLGTLQMLIDAARRGVTVELLIDDFGNELPTCLLVYLEELGVHTKVFNIMDPLRYRTLVDRMHGKMLITDRKNLIVGGRNLKEEYYALDSLNNFQDREVFVVADSAVAQARRHFSYLWENPRLSGRKKVKINDEQRACWRDALEKAPGVLQKSLRLAPLGQKDWLEEPKKTLAPVHFIYDNFKYPTTKRRGWRTRKDHKATNELIELVGRAKQSIDIEVAYYLPTRRWMKALSQAIDRGVKIRLVTNSGYSTDVPFIQSIYLFKRGRSLRSGMEIWEYRGPKMLHTKAMVIDGHISVIGSYNIEKQSHKYNTEVGVWVDDPAIAAGHLRLMEGTLKQSVRVGEKQVGPDIAQPTKLQKKRNRHSQWMRYTIAPLADLVL